MRRCLLLPLQTPQRADFVALHRVYGRRAALAPADVQTAGIQFDLMPLEIADLRGAQAVPVGDQDHGGVPVAVSTMLARGLDQPLDLAAGEIPPRAGD